MTTSEQTNYLTSPNLESLVCFWLDQDVHLTDDNRQTEHDLHEVIRHLRTFDDSDECEQNIRQINNENIVLIVSGSLGREIVPRLHDLPQLSSCYIYCRDKYTNKQWAKEYHKVKGVFVERAKLVAAIAEDLVAQAKVKNEASTSVILDHSPTRNKIFHVIPAVHRNSSPHASPIEPTRETY